MKGRVLKNRFLSGHYGMLVGEPIIIMPCLQPHIFPPDITLDDFRGHFIDNKDFMKMLTDYAIIDVEINEIEPPLQATLNDPSSI